MNRPCACLEQLLPYNRFNDWGQAFLFLDPPHSLTHLEANAKPYRIASYTALNPKSVDDVKQALLSNKSVCVGVPIFQDAWYDNGFTESIGEVQRPLTSIDPVSGVEILLDTPKGGHAIAIVGYKDTPNPNDIANFRPGGGYFAFKNSWGGIWAINNTEVKPGFGQLPYEYLQKYNIDAYVIG